MPAFIFAYRVPRDYTPGSPASMAAWRGWFDGLGTHVVEQGLPVVASSPHGNCGSETRLGGYSLIAADDLHAAIALAKGCPAIALNGGVEVGVLRDLDLIAGSPGTSSGDRAPATAS